MSMTTFRHVVRGTFPGESWSTTLHTTGTLTVAAANAAWETAWALLWDGQSAPNDNINQLVSQNVFTTAYETVTLDPVTGKQTGAAAGAVSLPGTATTVNCPPQDSCVISWTTATPTRAGRGRMYLPVFVAAALSGGLLSTASQLIVAKAGYNLWQSLIGAGLTPSIYSRSTKGTTVITGGNVGNIIDTQRRRRDKLVETRVALQAG